MRPRATPLLLLAAAAALAASSLRASRAHPFPIYDEAATLELSREFSREGGGAAQVAAYLSGRCREDNRHPLYSMLSAPFMDGTIFDFARAKLVSLACALALLAAVFWSCREIWGEGVALAAAAAVALMPETAGLSQEAAADILFAALYAAAVFLPETLGEGPAAWGAFGALAGLAYLAKGDGHFLLLAALVASLRRGRSRRQARVLPALAGFFATAGFLLARNLRVWGDPFHNVNSKVFWLDAWPQFRRLSWTPQWREVGPLWYARTHTAAQALARLGAGAVAAGDDLVRTLSLPTLGAWGERLCGALVAAAAALGARECLRRGRRGLVLRAVVPGAALFAAFSWYAPVAENPRFLYPVAVVVVVLAAVGAAALYERRQAAAPNLPRLARAALAGLGLWAALALARGGDPLRWAGVPADWAGASRAVAGRRYLIDDWSLYTNWDAGADTAEPYAMDAPQDEVRAFARARGLSAGVVDMHVWTLHARRDLYGRADALGPTTMLGWPRCFPPPGGRGKFLVFARACAPAQREGARSAR